MCRQRAERLRVMIGDCISGCTQNTQSNVLLWAAAAVCRYLGVHASLLRRFCIQNTCLCSFANFIYSFSYYYINLVSVCVFFFLLIFCALLFLRRRVHHIHIYSERTSAAAACKRGASSHFVCCLPTRTLCLCCC